MPTDRGIMFSAPMVLALLAGRKTQTRRLATSPLRKAQIGDRLWVRETHAYVGSVDPGWLLYRASGYEAECQRHGFDEPYPPESAVRWTPAIHMRRTASRLTLIVDAVRTEPLQAISATDAMAEGIERDGRLWRNYGGGDALMDPRASFRSLWESLHDKPGERWADNPDLVALSFIVRPGNIDRVGP